ncbi:MAG: PAS domain S-box protein [Proteobacteria bacterium]|nr:PAS domain S-box protein [Pseudomonadota bacterium]
MLEHEDRSFIGLLRYIWYKLVEPPTSIRDPTLRHQSSLLASLLVVLALLVLAFILIFSVPSTVRPSTPPLQNPDFYAVMFGGLFITIAYGMNRSGHYTLAAIFIVTIMFIEVYFAAVVTLLGMNPIYPATDINVLAYTIIPILLTSLLLPTPATTMATVINVSGILILPLVFPHVLLADIVGGPLSFILATSTLAIQAIRHQARLELIRRTELAEKEKQYVGLLDVTFEGLIISERECVIDLNPGAAQMFGYTRSEAIGRPLLDFIAEDVREELVNAIDAKIDQPIEAHGLRKDGSEFHIELVIQASTSPQARSVRAIAVRDITERKETEQALRRRNRELELLNQAGRALDSTLDLNQVFTIILEEVRRLLDAIAASIWFVDPETDELVCRQAVGPHEDIARGWRLAPGEGLAGWVAASGESMIVPDTRTDERHFKDVDRKTGLDQRSILSVPLRVKEKVVGVIQVMDVEANCFEPADMRLVESLAASAAMSVENARLYQETDTLRAFNENIVQNMQEGIMIEDTEGTITFVNPRGAEIMECTAGELIGQHTSITAAPEFLPKIEKETAQRPQGIASQYEAALVTKEKQRVPVIIHAQPLFNDDQFSGVLSVFTNITQLKQAEEGQRKALAKALQTAEALQESEEKYRSFVERANDGIAIVQDTMIKYANPRLVEMWSDTNEDIIHTPFIDYVHPDELPKVQDRYRRRLAGQEIEPVYETALERKNGKKIQVELSAGVVTYQGEPADLVIIRDITDRKQAVEALRRYTKRLGTLHAIDKAILAVQSIEDIAQIALSHIRELVPCLRASMAIFEDKHQKAIVFATHVNGTSTIHTGVQYSPLASTMKQLRQGKVHLVDDVLTFPESSQVVQALQTEGLRSHVTIPLIVQDELIGSINLGAQIPKAFTLEYVNIAREVADQVAVAMHQVRLRSALEIEEQRLKMLVKHLPEGVLLLDDERRILVANPIAQTYLSAMTETVSGNVLTYLADRSIDELLQPPPTGLWHELEVNGPSNQVFEVAAHVVKSEIERENYVLTLRDVTQERKIQEQIRMQDRLAIVGQLAAGIAHDFNNIMAIITLYAQMMSKRRDMPSQDREKLTTISQQATRATDLIKQILGFSRASTIEQQPLDLNPFLNELVKMLERTLPKNIELKLIYGHDEYIVKANPTSIQQIVMNLAVNAHHAMPKGGTLGIELRRVRVVPDKPLPLPEMEYGEWIQISVSDTGTGIPSDVLPHIFESFFTTKASGKGTGLGLTQVQGIVKQHRGHLSVETLVGQGTTFTVHLPALELEEWEPLNVETDSAVRGQGEKILLIEDQAETRKAVALALQSFDYKVLAAANGQEALTLYAQRQDEIALVLSDMMMPGISGAELFQALVRQNPDVKIITITGYSQQMNDLDSVGANVVNRLQKPMDIDQLAMVIEQALEGVSR